MLLLFPKDKTFEVYFLIPDSKQIFSHRNLKHLPIYPNNTILKLNMILKETITNSTITTKNKDNVMLDDSCLTKPFCMYKSTL